jgi:uncharacterized repeat protein (TIGR01451 family)
MKNRLRKLVSLISVFITLFGMSIPVLARPARQGNCVITGTVYRDFNASGTRDALEPPVAGIEVTAYSSNGTDIDNDVTNDQGEYTLDQLPDGVTALDEVRIEFTGLPSFLRYGPDGTESYTSVVFVTCANNAGTIDLAVANPGQHCIPDPDLVTTCFILGDQQTGPNTGDAVVRSIAYTAGSRDVTSAPAGGRFDGPNTILADTTQVGSAFGVAWRRQTETLYVSAFLKRHTGLGPEGPGAIYEIDVANGGAPTLFTTLPAANGGEDLHTDGTAYADRPQVDPWLIDAEVFDLVGKRSLGDITMSEDDSTLFVVNLFNRQLYSIPVDNPGAASSVNLPTNLPGCPAAGDARPFSVAMHDGLVYVGIVCTAESTQDRDDLRAYVYSHNPAGGGFNLVLNIPLNYERRCSLVTGDPNCRSILPANWRPWTSDFRTDFIARTPTNSFDISYPQPWLTDIEFDNNGDMILGFRDRFGDQIGNEAYSTLSGDLRLFRGVGPGDILRACLTGPNSWEMESNGACGGITTRGSNNVGQGPGNPGGEYYFQDHLVGIHDENSLGGLVQVNGQPEVVGTFLDPIPISGELFDGGLRWMDNVTGQVRQAYRVYDGVPGSENFFGKANGLGGLEAFCPPAPIEIGNRIWYDVDRNGVQDPGEEVGAGITVNLYDSSGNLVATTVTNQFGEYLFTSLNDNVEFNTDYVIRLDNPADYAPGGPLFEWFLTGDNEGPNQRDSDASEVNGFPQISMTTGGPGENDHTFDFGFNRTPTNNDDDDDTGETTDDDGGGSPAGEFAVSENLELDKSVDRPFGQPGDLITWTIRVTHKSGDAIPSVTVTDTLQDGLEIVSTSATAGNVSVSGQTVTIVISPLNSGQSVTVTIQTRISDDLDTLIFDNTAYADGLSDTARLVIAGELVRTGETPWWRTPLIVLGLGILTAGAGYGLYRRRATS